MKKIEMVVTNPILVGIIMLKDLIELFKTFFVLNNFNIKSIVFDWWDFSIKLLISISLWLILRAYFDLKNKFENEMIVSNLISHVRSQRLFIKSFENINFVKLPSETEEQYYNRIPEGGLFQQHYFKEYQDVKNELQNNLMTEKSPIEINKLLSKWYPFKD